MNWKHARVGFLTRRGQAVLLWLVVAALGVASTARADGPLLVGERPTIDPFFLGPPTAWLDLDYFYDNQTQKTQGSPAVQFTENRYQEVLTARDTGYILSPNLVDLKLQGSFGLQQDEIDEENRSGTENGLFYNWDLDATLFRKDEIPVTVYSRRVTSLFSQPFGPSLENTLTTEGIVFDWQNATVPTRVEYYHLEQDENALNGSQSYSQIGDVLTWHSLYEPTQQNRSAFDYTFNTGNSSNGGTDFGGQLSNHYADQNVALSNELDFGPKAKSFLQSALNYQSDTGTFQLSDLRYDEILYLQNRDNLSTTFQYLLDDQSVGAGFGSGNTSQLLQRAEAQFTHRLYDSLVTTGEVAVQRLDVDPSGGETDYSASIAFDYDKIVPLGKLSSNLSVGYDQTDNDASGQETHIVNQQITFSGALPQIIRGNNIVADSVIITDFSSTRIYVPGVDYVVRAFDNYIEIERILGGNIAGGQTVLLSYALGAQPANTLRTNDFTTGVRYDINTGPLRGLGLYAQYTDQDQSVSPNLGEAYVPASLVDKLIGVDYRIWQLKFLAEQDWHHSAVSPYNQFRAEARWSVPVTRQGDFALDAGYLNSHFLQNDDRLTDLTVGASAGYRVSRDLSVNGSVTWQDQDDRLFGSLRGLEETLQLQWSHRDTSVSLQLRNSDLKYQIQQNQIQTIEVEIRRTF